MLPRKANLFCQGSWKGFLSFEMSLNSANDLVIQNGVTFGHHFNGLGQPGRLYFFEQIPRSSRLHALYHKVSIEGGEEDNACGGALVYNVSARINATAIRQANIHEHNVRLVFKGCYQGLRGRADLADHLKVVFLAENVLQADTNERMILHKRIALPIGL